MLVTTLLALALTSFAPRAATVALLENYFEGKRLELEPGGRFSHVALKVGDRYLHAHQAVGVELTDSLERFGVCIELFENPDVPEPTPEQVREALALRYHPRHEWAAHDGTTYSARLVGELLGIAPRPALYQTEIWTGFRPGSVVGLSPDDIHRVITQDLGFRWRGCEGRLVHLARYSCAQ